MPGALDGCYVISLRPAGQHATLRRAAAARGARVLALSPWRLAGRDDAATRRALDAALAGACVIATSPAAVGAAASLRPLQRHRGQQWFAIGKATARALARAGVEGAIVPARVDSEGVLEALELRDIGAQRIGLLTAPGGRDLIEPRLRARGVDVARADVYARVPIHLSARAVATLAGLDAPRWLALSSGGALEHVLAQLPSSARERLLAARVAASSARLAGLARSLEFAAVTQARGPGPQDLLAAIVADASASMRGIAIADPPQ
jgi:uroporphyrinogen-III synthase